MPATIDTDAWKQRWNLAGYLAGFWLVDYLAIVVASWIINGNVTVTGGLLIGAVPASVVRLLIGLELLSGWPDDAGRRAFDTGVGLIRQSPSPAASLIKGALVALFDLAGWVAFAFLAYLVDLPARFPRLRFLKLRFLNASSQTGIALK